MNNSKRIIGFDIARALAIFGMVVVNFKIAMNAKSGSPFLLWVASLFEGRASALFVVLAGVGVTFLTNKSRLSNDVGSIKTARYSLLKRALLLIVIGLAYTPIWEADILHFYGFYFLIASMLFTTSNKKLLFFAAVIVLMFPVLMVFFDYSKGWDWSVFKYHNLWTIDGMVRHIFFNGFHPVFPWAAFLIFGMWLGRQELSIIKVRKKLFKMAFVIWVVTEFVFLGLRTYFKDSNDFGMGSEDLQLLFSTSIIPPFPQYMIAASSLAVMVIVLCLHFSERFYHSKITQWLYKTGQLALTLYVAHVILGMGILESMNKLGNQSIKFSLFSALTFCVFSIIFSVLWLKYFKIGPLEWVFRKLTR